MKLEDLNEAMEKSGEAIRLAEEIDGRLIDGRLLLNQRDTAKLVGITARAFAEWPINPIRRVGRQKFFYWPDVRELADERYRAQTPR
jgi:hypothetical protein